MNMIQSPIEMGSELDRDPPCNSHFHFVLSADCSIKRGVGSMALL